MLKTVRVVSERDSAFFETSFAGAMKQLEEKNAEVDNVTFAAASIAETGNIQYIGFIYYEDPGEELDS